MAGLVLLVVVGVGAVAQWSGPGSGTAAPTPDPSPTADGPQMSIGHGFIPDAPTADASGSPDGVGTATGTATSDETTVIDAATGLPVDEAQATGPWWRRALPIAGDLVPIGGDVHGSVRLEVVGEQVVQITLTSVRVTSGPRTSGPRTSGSGTSGSGTSGSGTSGSHVGAVRVELSAGDVIGTERAQWTGDDVPADFGSFTPDGEHPVLVMVDPQDLPPVVHSALLFDADTGDLLGGAELLPVF
ncbi:hypothetical protein E9228_000914 [Curtobacterium flaccumfaciens]|uniref:Bacterial spore germination immunoglobulin-like domain-containing protein n=1 Tax=Curtobacterium salicis TaxID=1779862 RepID=A0ABX0T457_9MICO|nr:hypothetical protein [Curtobacterium sp. WW7]NII40278.1 hypothetical protein [Curtobacterium sp. WW7]